MTSIKVKDYIGNHLKAEDAILLRDVVKQNLKQDVLLDFKDVDRVSSTFFYNLLTDIMYKEGRDYVANHVDVKNLSNIKDFRRVLFGTAF